MNNNIIEYPCLICKKEVITDAIECSVCRNWLHRNCAKLSKKDLIKLSNNDYYWYCVHCTVLFPFHNVFDAEFDYLNSGFDMNYKSFELLNKCKKFEIKAVDQNEFKLSKFEYEIDPDKHFINTVEAECKYFTEDQFIAKMSKINGFSIIHFNCRSSRNCYEDLKIY